MFSPIKIDQGDMTYSEYVHAKKMAALERNYELFYSLISNGHQGLIRSILDEFDRQQEQGTFLQDESRKGYPVMRLLNAISFLSISHYGQVKEYDNRLRNIMKVVSGNGKGTYAEIINRILKRIQ